MIRVSVGEYELCCQEDAWPPNLADDQPTTLVEEFAEADADGRAAFSVSVGRTLEPPFLVVVQRYSPSGPGFSPGVLLVPETHRLFIGAGQRLLGYDLSGPARLWEDETNCGFWSWARHGHVVLMSAELELAAWDIDGSKLWTRCVEPPWQYSVEGERICVDVMGTESCVNLLSGAPEEK